MSTQEIRKHIEIIKESSSPKPLDENTLNEDLGSLLKIDKDLRSPFMVRSWARTKKNNQVLKGKFGRYSEIKPVDKKVNTSSLVKILTDKEESLQGVVVLLEGKQFMSIHFEGKKTYSGSKKDIAVYMAIKEDVMKDYIEMGLDDIDDRISLWGRDGVITGESLTVSKISTILRKIVKAAKDKGAKISLLGVYADQERATLQKDRTAARSGVINDPSGREFRDIARRALSHRLSKFKEKKAVSIDSAEDLLQTIIEKGYLANITIAGYPYKMEAVRGIENLLDPERRNRGDSYVQYNTGWRNVHDASEEGREIPEKLFVTFKLEGSSIVPSEVKTDARDW